MDNRECGGSNVWVLFLNPLIKVGSNISNFMVEGTEISYGVNGIGNVVAVMCGFCFTKHQL